MTTSTHDIPTDAPADLPMRPRGARRSAATDELPFQESAAPAMDSSSEDWAATALLSLESDAGLPVEEHSADPEPVTVAATADPEPGAAGDLPVQAQRASASADIPGEEASRAARAAARSAAADLGLSPKAAELLQSLLILSATDLSRGYPWRVHNMSARDWYEGFLFEDASSWLQGVGDAFSMRAFRTAMSGADALAAFNSLTFLCLTPGIREEANGAVQQLLTDQSRIKRILEAAQI